MGPEQEEAVLLLQEIPFRGPFCLIKGRCLPLNLPSKVKDMAL